MIKIDELIGEFNKRSFTTFVVSNGQCVERLRNLENEPYQLYLSLDAPTKEIFNEVCRPKINNAWDNLNESLESHIIKPLFLFDCLIISY